MEGWALSGLLPPMLLGGGRQGQEMEGKSCASPNKTLHLLNSPALGCHMQCERWTAYLCRREGKTWP